MGHIASYIPEGRREDQEAGKTNLSSFFFCSKLAKNTLFMRVQHLAHVFFFTCLFSKDKNPFTVLQSIGSVGRMDRIKPKSIGSAPCFYIDFYLVWLRFACFLRTSHVQWKKWK